MYKNFANMRLLTGGWDMCGGNVGLGGLGAVGTGADAGTGGGIGAGASVAGLEICPPVSGGDPPAPFAGGKTCGEEEGNSSRKKFLLLWKSITIFSVKKIKVTRRFVNQK